MSWINSNNAGPLRRIVNQSRIVSSTLECSVAKRGTYINITYFFDDYVNMCFNRELGRNPTRHHMGDKFLNQRPTDVGWTLFSSPIENQTDGWTNKNFTQKGHKTQHCVERHNGWESHQIVTLFNTFQDQQRKKRSPNPLMEFN